MTTEAEECLLFQISERTEIKGMMPSSLRWASGMLAKFAIRAQKHNCMLVVSYNSGFAFQQSHKSNPALGFSVKVGTLHNSASSPYIEIESNISYLLQRDVNEGGKGTLNVDNYKVMFFTCSVEECSLLNLTLGDKSRFVHYQDLKDELGL